MGRKVGSKDRFPRKKRLKPPTTQETLQPEPTPELTPEAVKEPHKVAVYIPVPVATKRGAKRTKEDRLPRGVSSLAKKRTEASYREYCLDVLDMAERQGVLPDLFHLMHAFKLILQAHHEGMASDKKPQTSLEVLSLSDLRHRLKR